MEFINVPSSNLCFMNAQFYEYERLMNTQNLAIRMAGNNYSLENECEWSASGQVLEWDNAYID